MWSNLQRELRKYWTPNIRLCKLNIWILPNFFLSSWYLAVSTPKQRTAIGTGSTFVVTSVTGIWEVSFMWHVMVIHTAWSATTDCTRGGVLNAGKLSTLMHRGSNTRGSFGTRQMCALSVACARDRWLESSSFAILERIRSFAPRIVPKGTELGI